MAVTRHSVGFRWIETKEAAVGEEQARMQKLQSPSAVVPQRAFPGFLLALIALTYAVGLTVTIMDIDAAQYASISLETLRGDNPLVITHRGKDYLDKPPLLFWLSALSMRLLGPTTAAYKLPSFLWALIGIAATFGLGRMLHGKRVGLVAALLLACSQGYIFFTNDVRTDTILTGAAVLAVWQLAAYAKAGSMASLLVGAGAAGCAMLAKGPIGMMVPVLGVGAFVAAGRKWRVVARPAWLVAILVVAVLLAPMVWGLWVQHGWKGVRFYFWTQSFGRITGESSWRNDAGILFFVHTFLWAFLPWAFVTCYAVGERVVRLFRRENDPERTGDALVLGAFLLTFAALSLSKYKLPHYIFVTLPYAAIVTARLLVLVADSRTRDSSYRWILRGQAVVCVLVWLTAVSIPTLAFPSSNAGLWALTACLGFLTFVPLTKRFSRLQRLLYPSCVALLGLNLVLNLHGFPSLLKYQSGSTIAGYALENNIPSEKIIRFSCTRSHALDFYLRHSVPTIHDIREVEHRVEGGGVVWAVTNSAGLHEITTSEKPLSLYVLPVDHYRITRVTPGFLWYRSRHRRAKKRYLVRIERMEKETRMR